MTTLRVIEKKSFDLSDHSSSLSGVKYVILSCNKKDIEPGKIRLLINDCDSAFLLSWNNEKQALKVISKFLEILTKALNALENDKALNRHYLLGTVDNVKYYINVALFKNKFCVIDIYKKSWEHRKTIIRLHSDFVCKYQYEHCEENFSDFKTRIVNLSIALISLEKSLRYLSEIKKVY